MALGKKTKAYEAIARHAEELVRGCVLSVDPSIGSGKSGSSPGWAVYLGGELQASGILSIKPSKEIPFRLQDLAGHMYDLYDLYCPNILIYEDVPSSGYGRSAISQASLHKAIGAILSVPGPHGFVGIMPISWTKLTRPGYVKSDENDAIEIGWICIQEAKRILRKEKL
jgi:hypothetical protein